MEDKTRQQSLLKMMIYTSIMVALLCIGMIVKIPMPPEAFTLQTLFVMAAGIILGPKWGAISCLVYLFMGLIGLPVFANGGGVMYVLKPSFGFLISFPIQAFFIGILYQNTMQKIKEIPRSLIICLLSIIVSYFIGISWYVANLNILTETTTNYWKFAAAFLIYLPGDIAKAIACSLIAPRISRMVHKK